VNWKQYLELEKKVKESESFHYENPNQKKQKTSFHSNLRHQKILGSEEKTSLPKD
jgi:hypothetical protein